MFSKLTPTYKGILLGLIGYSFFTVPDMLVKSVASTYSLPQIVASQSFFSVILLLLFSRQLGGLRSLRDMTDIKIHIFRGFVGLSLALMAAYLFMNLPMTTVYTAIFTQPFFAVIFAVLLYKERAHPARWLTIIIGFSGVLIAFRPWDTDISPLLLALLLLVPVAIAALYIVMRSLKSSSLLAIALLPIAFNLIVTSPFAVMDFPVPTLQHVLTFMAMGCFSCVGFLALSTAYRVADASVAGPTHYVQMLWGLIWGYFIFGDVPDIWMMAGAVVIIGSGVYLILHEND